MACMFGFAPVQAEVASDPVANGNEEPLEGVRSRFVPVLAISALVAEFCTMRRRREQTRSTWF